MNLVEVWFGIVERQAIHLGVFKSVKDLNTKIRTFVAGWDDRSHPLRLDHDRRGDPREGEPFNKFRSAALVLIDDQPRKQ